MTSSTLANNYGNLAWASGVATPPCYAIDPLMVARFGATVDNFTAPNGAPHSTCGGPFMKRLTITTALTRGRRPSLHFARRSRIQATHRRSRKSRRIADGGVFLRKQRKFQAGLRWAIHLVGHACDVFGDPVLNAPRMPDGAVDCRIQSARFGAAGVAGTAPQNATAPTERTVKAVPTNANSISGGDLTLSDANPLNVAVNVGEWIMLGRVVTDVSATASSGQRPMFRWYRVVTAPPATLSGATWSRNITVAGPDWNLKNNASPMMAYVYDGAVAVYERTIRLEGPSLWWNDK